MAQSECPRCGQPATGTARRRGHCTSCGAPLVSAASPREADVRAYLYGNHHLHLLPLETWSQRRRAAS